MLKILRSLTLSLIVTNFIARASEPASSSADSSSSSDKRLYWKKLNSLVEAYMSGALRASSMTVAGSVDRAESSSVHDKDVLTPIEVPISKIVRYPDYVDSSSTHEEPLSEAYERLTAVYSEAMSKIQGQEIFPFQQTLYFMKKKEKRIEYLRNLSEDTKVEFQLLRLYDFITDNNPSLPKAQLAQLKQVTSDDTLSDEQKAERCEALLNKDFPAQRKAIEANRKTLATAMRQADIDAINAASSRPLHLAEFVTLDKDIQEMVADVENDEDDSHALIRKQCVVM